jgi:hypothetical protein
MNEGHRNSLGSIAAAGALLIYHSYVAVGT